MRFWVGVASAFGAGTIAGVFAGIIMTEEKCKAEYRESAASYRRAMEAARIDRLAGAVPLQTEGELLEGGMVEEIDRGDNVTNIVAYKPDDATFTPAPSNPYHRAVNAVDTPVEMFVEGGVNDYGISYIEDEDFMEEDGRIKNHITMVMDEANTPTFFLDGAQIHDWDERLGDSILVDFHRLVPPGVTPVLYVRNHKTDEDYEVSRELP